MLMVVWSVVVRVSVDDDRQTAEQILAAENWTRNHSVPRVPNGKSIAEQIFALASDFEAHDHLPVAVPARDLVPDRSRHRLLVGCEADIALREHD